MTFIPDLCTALRDESSKRCEKVNLDLYTDGSEDNSSFGGDGDHETQEKTKKRNKIMRKKGVQSKGINESDSQNDEPSEDESENIVEISREANLETDRAKGQ